MKFNTNYLIFIFILASSFYGGQGAKGEGDCMLKYENGTELSTKIWEDGIILDPIEDVEKSGKKLTTLLLNGNEIVVDFSVNNNSDAVNLYVDLDSEKNLTIKTNEKFEKYENEEVSLNMEINIVFKCPNGKKSSLVIIQPIEDSNNHDPKFLEPNYVLKLPVMIEEGFEFDLSDQILVRDVDLTNTDIKFTTENSGDGEKSGFRFMTIRTNPKNKKEYLTKLIAEKTISLIKNLTFTLYATDSGNPSRNTSTSITVIGSKDILFLPKFSKSYYTSDLVNFNYKKNDKAILNFFQGNLSLDKNYKRIKEFKFTTNVESNLKHFNLILNNDSMPQEVFGKIELIDFSENFLRQKAIVVNLSVFLESSHKEAISTELHVILPAITDKNASIEKDEGYGNYMISAFLCIFLICVIGCCLYVMVTKIEHMKTFIHDNKSKFQLSKSKDTVTTKT